MKIISLLLGLYKEKGKSNYGENVSQLEHAVQCGELAVRSNASSALVCAALLHDIGHLLLEQDKLSGDSSNSLKHDEIGARFLARHFP